MRALESGQGTLRGRGAECFLITPEHVTAGADRVHAIGFGRVNGSAVVETVFPPDIAVARLEPGSNLVCPGDWDKAPGLKDALVNLPTGTLLSVNEDGSRKQRGVKVAEFDERYIYVQAARPAEDFFQGMSGSSLELGNQRAGMLLQVDLERGYGVVIRQDYLTNAIAPFFDAASAAGSVEEVLTLLGSLEGEARLEALRSSASKIPSNISGSAAGRILLGLREEHRVRGLEIFVDKLKSNLDAKELNKIVSNEPGRTRV